jgi:NitT/TauT family transport system permease protein
VIDGDSIERVVRGTRAGFVGPSRARGRLAVPLSAAFAPGLLSLLAGFAAWECVSRIWAIPFLPPFSTVLRTAVRMTLAGEILRDLAFSLGNLALGYCLAVFCGIGAGLVAGRYRKASFALDPLVTAMLASPKLLFVPPLYAVFGVSRSSQIAVIFLSAVFIIVANTTSAVRTVDTAAVQMALSFGANRRQLFWKVLLPGSLPLTMAGLRLGMGRAVAGMITGEMFITVFGLGAQLHTYGNRFDAASVLAILLIVVGVALICGQAVRMVEQHFTQWTPQTGDRGFRE